MTVPLRVLVADAIASDGLAPLRDDRRFELVNKPGLSGDALAAAMADVDAVLVRSATKITRESLSKAERLKVIGRAGVGVDTIDVDAATEKGIAVLTAPSGNTISACELTFALLLALVRRVPAADRSMHDGAWDRKSFGGVELYGKTLGLVGAGRIGGEVAKRARAFGMRVLVYDPYLTDERAKALDAELTTLDDVLSRADVISLHVPLTESTQGLIGRDQLAKLKRGAMVVNASRGGVIDEAALVEALRERRIAGAALDVFEQEPLPKDHPLRSLANVVLTPHLGASTEEAQQNVALEIAEAVRAALTDGDFSRAVNAPAVGGEEMRRLRPLLDLAERLGRLASTMLDGALQSTEVRYAGAAGEDALRPLSASALVGMLSGIVGRRNVNFVNAGHIAKTRGLDVRRTRMGEHRAFAEFVEVRASSRDREVRVAGALLGGGHPRIVRIGQYHVDVVPKGTLVVLRNRDVPGVIGRVGTLLGNAGINIGEYHQARLEAGGEAIAAISVDGRLDAEVVARLRALPEVIDARQAQLD
ncbi:MAG TPA: phosphoglycerate dehydrogenase [Gemmatimonadaceae bacterium]|nr:phosphoglycerate dehydrogenase [Gemmatimonadaceae bacterium]